MTVFLIRHGQTRGNLERRWTGTTDEPLAPEGVALARRSAGTGEFLPRRVWSSPLLRCRETAAILYPRMEPEDSPHFQANTNRHMASNNDWRDSA